MRKGMRGSFPGSRERYLRHDFKGFHVTSSAYQEMSGERCVSEENGEKDRSLDKTELVARSPQPESPYERETENSALRDKSVAV